MDGANNDRGEAPCDEEEGVHRPSRNTLTQDHSGSDGRTVVTDHTLDTHGQLPGLS